MVKVFLDVKRLIVLMTDYGYRDPYVGVVKGVIKSINPNAEIIDLTHGIQRHNVLEAAVMLAVSAKYFPKGSIFVVVVDPGVGSARRSILIETTNYILIGPDNGCLTLLAERDGVKRVFDISNSKYRLPEVSATFHGRDVFAPIAAWVSLGVPLEDVGVEISYDSVVKTGVEKPSIHVDMGVIEARVVYIDVFGNVMTNIEREDLKPLGLRIGDELSLHIPSGEYKCKYVPSFSWVGVGELACYINSWGFFEVAINMGDASRVLGLKQGDPIKIVVHKNLS